MIVNNEISIISNNCIGADICHGLGLRFNSPTVNMQILPTDYLKFVSNIRHYTQVDIKECNTFTQEQEWMINRTYDRPSRMLEFPFAVCDDILLCFQHFKTYDEAKSAWDRRCRRVNYEHLGIIFIERWDRFRDELITFEKLDLGCFAKKTFYITDKPLEQDEDMQSMINVVVPQDIHFMEYEGTTKKKYYEKNFDVVSWASGL